MALRRGRRALFLSGLLLASSVAVAFVASHQGTQTANATTTGAGTLQLQVTSGTFGCTPDVWRTKCPVAANTTFQLSVVVADVPSAGYNAIQTEVEFTTTYKISSSPSAEIAWPDSSLPVRRWEDRKSTRLNSSHSRASRMPSSA